MVMPFDEPGESCVTARARAVLAAEAVGCRRPGLGFASTVMEVFAEPSVEAGGAEA
jgi:hypothetical protein